MGAPSDEAEFHRRLLDNAWYDAKKTWTDGGAKHFDQHHYRQIDLRSRAYSEALRKLTDALAAAERATEY